MKQCQYCRREMLPKAKQCPGCGAPVLHKPIHGQPVRSVRKSSGKAEDTTMPYVEPDESEKVIIFLIVTILATSLIVMLLVSAVSGARSRGIPPDPAGLYEAAMGLEIGRGEAFIKILQEAGIEETHAVEYFGDSKEGWSVYKVDSSKGELTFYLDGGKDLVKIYSERADTALFEHGEIKIKYVDRVFTYKSRLQEILEEQLSMSVYLGRTNTTTGWMDSRYVYFKGEALVGAQDWSYYIILDAGENPVYVFIEGTEYINEIEYVDTLA